MSKVMQVIPYRSSTYYLLLTSNRKIMNGKKILAIAAILVMGIALLDSCNMAPPEGSRDAQALRGKAIFEKQCISCHGLGDVAPTVTDLETTPPDLTEIMIRRPKAKEFPVVDIARIIDGRRLVKAHGPRDMPVWGEVYAAEGLDDTEIRGRKGELVAFLMSIQKWR